MSIGGTEVCTGCNDKSWVSGIDGVRVGMIDIIRLPELRCLIMHGL
jgi:hypothetical protein